MNRNFASIDADRKFTFAPDGVIYEGRFHTRPTAEMYAANGYLPFLDERPVETGYTFAPLDTATERDGVLYRDYERTAIVPNLQAYDDAMEAKIRETREARGYTTREPSVYALSTNQRMAQDAKDWTAYVTACMEYAEAEKQKYENGAANIPTVEQFVAAMPVCVWTMPKEAANA